MQKTNSAKGAHASAPHTHTHVDFSHEQLDAIDLCCDLDEAIVSVTGGAGTGKTQVLGAVYAQLCESQPKGSVVLCAPTGRAAKRITELTGIPAMTIHRLLEFPKPNEMELLDGSGLDPRRNAQNRLEQRVVIVDEASMLAPTLFQQLCDALPRKGILRFFGDNNQLPPVEEGVPPFIDILKRRPSITLTFNYRSQDAIVGNALRVLRGSIPLRNAQFEILYTSNPMTLLLDMMKDRTEFAGANNQILIPARKGKYGTTIANVSLQMRFNPRGRFLQLRRYDDNAAQLLVRGGDKFLWITNDYYLEMFNGELGRIESVEPEDGSLELEMDNRHVHVPARIMEYDPWSGHPRQRDPRKQIDLGYAITIHKAQGSEFDTVVLCMSSAHGRKLINRRSFYTAITRARKRVIIISDARAMGYAMQKHGV